VSARFAAAVALFLGASLLAAACARAQALLPAQRLMSRYEIERVVRAAGFVPLAPPMRQGVAYVVRATDSRSAIMRVVVDGHSGAIRAVNRIVPGLASADEVGMTTSPPYWGPSYGVPPGGPLYGPYGAPAFGGPPYASLPLDQPPEAMPDVAPDIRPNFAPSDAAASPPLSPPPPPGAVPTEHPRTVAQPPLPRPRPAFARRVRHCRGQRCGRQGAPSRLPANASLDRPAGAPLFH